MTESKKKSTCATMHESHDCTSYNIQTQRGVKRQFTITHVGERWVDSGGESWAELGALKMKRIESTQGKILVNGCSQTKR